MAVPKKKTSKSKRGMRRSHQNHKRINIVVNSKGVPSLPGHIALDGTYGGTLVVPEKESSKKEERPGSNA